MIYKYGDIVITENGIRTVGTIFRGINSILAYEDYGVYSANDIKPLKPFPVYNYGDIAKIRPDANVWLAKLYWARNIKYKKVLVGGEKVKIVNTRENGNAYDVEYEGIVYTIDVFWLAYVRSRFC